MLGYGTLHHLPKLKANEMEIEKHTPKWLLNEIRNAESDAHALFKIIEFQKALTEQCNIANVVGNEVKFESGLTCMMCRQPKEKDGHTCCEDCAGLAF